MLDELRGSDRRLSLQTRESLAAEAFAYTARYDTAITRWFQEKHEDFPPLIVRAFERQLELPYGENPHQRAAFYTQIGTRAHVLSQVAQLGGKELSFNNLLDLDSARQLLAEFVVPACVIVKHNNPCGVAVATTTLEAYRRAFACDPTSAFGGVIVLNRRVDELTAEAIHEQFAEVVLARGFDDEALEIFSDKPNMRILDDRERRLDVLLEPAFRQVIGGLLVQDRDASNEDREEMQVVSERRPTEEEWSELLFAWRVCKHVKSNAIVLARDGATIGLGAGQMSRVDSVRIAIEKSQSPVQGSVLASDAFFPFPDGPEIALEQGVTATDPAGRLDPRPAGGRGGRSRGRGDGLHQPPSLPALAPRCSARPGVRVSDDEPSIRRPGGDDPSIRRLGGDPPSPYEAMFGFNRVVTAGPWVLISGTTSVDPERLRRRHDTLRADRRDPAQADPRARPGGPVC